MKRVYFTLALMSLFGGLNAFAQTYKIDNGVKYGLMQNGQCVVIGDAGATGDITFKKEVEFNDGMHTVTGVCGSGDYKDVTGKENGFSGNTNITGITFEDGSQITWIGDHAFKNCSKLNTINKVPDVLNEIKSWCFEGTGLERVDLSNTKVTIMQDGVFYNNTSLTSIKLPNKLENFWDNAFYGCKVLNNIVMPSTVKGIYNNVFEGCEALSNVTFNDSYTTLGHHVFKNCPLAAVTFPNSLKSIGEYAFENTKLNTVDLSNTQITSLPNGCFFICENLSDVKLPKDLTDIGNNAFISTPIASITFPSSLQKIGDCAFQKAKLENVVIPTNCNAIEQGAFSENTKLTTVYINGVTCYLAVDAFANCGNLKDVYITSNVEPDAKRYGYPFKNNSAYLTVHVVPNYLDTFTKLETCNAPKFDSNFSITLGKEWTTLTSAYNLDFSNVEGGLTAYTAKYNEKKDAVALTPVKKVKAHTGLILKGEAGQTYIVPILASNEAGLDEATGNDLVDCVDAIWSTGRDNDYFLHDGEFVKSKNNGWALPGKSYLYISGGRTNKSESSPLRVYIDNTATAINGITNNPVVKDEAYYNLQGVKVQHPQHGVFIHNGKKVVLK